MSRQPVNRRDFNKLSVAALGGLVAGSAIGCGKKEEEKPPVKPAGGGEGEGSVDISQGGPNCWMSGEKNICRGLNVCKGHGKGDHECAGQGSCATGVTAHDCGTLNSCACEGGCGENIGENKCKGEGGCAVPIKSEDMWKSARKKFEEAMTKADKKFGKAPAKEA